LPDPASADAIAPMTRDIELLFQTQPLVQSVTFVEDVLPVTSMQATMVD
jgi:hypothetical protein